MPVRKHGLAGGPPCSRIAPALSSTQYRLHLSPKSNPITNGALDDDCLVTADSVRCLIAVSSQGNPQPKDYCRISEARQLHFYLHLRLTSWGQSTPPAKGSFHPQFIIPDPGFPKNSSRLCSCPAFSIRRESYTVHDRD
jgi:hypothetical protein